MTEVKPVQPDYNDKPHKRSRLAYLLECDFEYLVALLMTDAFLAKVLKDIGMSDATIGIVSSLISLAFLFNFFSVFVVQRITDTKKFVVIFHTVGQLFFMSLYFVPLLPAFEGSPYRQVLAVAAILIGYFGNYFVTSIIYKWGNSFVRPDRRARYCAAKETVSLMTGVVFTLVVGVIMDRFEMSGDLHGGFLFAAMAMLIFSTCDFVCLMLIKNRKMPPKAERPPAVPMREVWRNTMGNRRFVNVLILQILWDVARYTTIGFMAIYRLEELALSLTVIQIVNVAGNLFRSAVTAPLGMFSDRFSYARGIELSLCVAVVSFVFCAFTTPATWVFTIVWTILFNGCQAGVTQNLNSVVYNYVDERYFVQASAVKSSIAGLCGFGASLLGGVILTAVQKNGNTLFGMQIYGQQVLSAISAVLLLVAALFTHFVIAKQKRLIQ